MVMVRSKDDNNKDIYSLVGNKSAGVEIFLTLEKRRVVTRQNVSTMFCWKIDKCKLRFNHKVLSRNAVT